jgi:hypothetical protein
MVKEDNWAHRSREDKCQVKCELLQVESSFCQLLAAGVAIGEKAVSYRELLCELIVLG